jgi:UDP-glucuronate 4-epimerase
MCSRVAAAPNPVWSGEAPDPATSRSPWHVYNIGNSQPIEVTEVVRLIEEALGKPAIRELLPMQPGDVLETYADVFDLEGAVGFRPEMPIGKGVHRFVDWFQSYHALEQCSSDGRL